VAYRARCLLEHLVQKILCCIVPVHGESTIIPGAIHWKWRISVLIFLILASLPVCAQQVQGPNEPVVVTGTYEPLSLEEIDRAIRVLPVRSQSLGFNTLVDVLRLDPSIDLASRAPNGIQADLSIRGSSFG